MNKFTYLTVAALVCSLLSSCWVEELPERGVARHQVEELVATPGDEEVVLSWTMPQGWNPTDFIVTYNDVASEAVELSTDGAMTFTVPDLVNEHEYSFGVQAVYDGAVSGKVSVKGKPTTSRFPVNGVLEDSGDSYVTLMWIKPSNLVSGYEISYYKEGDPDNVTTLTADADAVKYDVEGLENDVNYVFTIVTKYPKGDSEAVTIKAMPAIAIPYFVSSTSVAAGWPVTFTFNRAEFEDATDVKWTFPDGTVLTDDVVTKGIEHKGDNSVVEQTVTLSAMVRSDQKTWPITMTVRKWVVEANTWAWNNTNPNGFKSSYPLLSPDGKTVYGTVYFKISSLYAYDIESGTEKWRYVPAVQYNSNGPGAVNPVTGDIYFGNNKQFHCVKAEDGTARWVSDVMGDMRETPAPAVSADGSTVYAVNKAGIVRAFNASTGAQLWTADLGTKCGALLLNNNDLIAAVCTTTDAIRFINASDGTQISSISLTRKPTDISGMAVSDDRSTAYIPLQVSGDMGGMASIDLSSRTLIKEFAFGGNNMYAPVISSDGYLVVGCKDSKVYGLKPDLSEVVWTYTHLVDKNNAFNYSHMCADNQGRAFISSGGSSTAGDGTSPYYTLIIQASTGAILDKYYYKDPESDAEKQQGGNNFNAGVLYSAYIGTPNGSTQGVLLGKYIGGERKFWGGPGGDICGSCCVQSPLLNK